jgi:hypothetical protein
MENKKCLKPPTSISMLHHEEQQTQTKFMSE